MRRSSFATPANGTARPKAAGRGRPLLAYSVEKLGLDVAD